MSRRHDKKRRRERRERPTPTYCFVARGPAMTLFEKYEWWRRAKEAREREAVERAASEHAATGHEDSKR